MKKKKDDEKKGIVESFLGGIPIFGDFFKELGKTETFKEKFKDVNEKIEENLRKGEKRYVSVEGNISVRPLAIRPSTQRILSEIKKEVPEAELEIGKDYAYEKKRNKLLLAVKVLKEDVDVSIKGRTLFIKGDNFQKKLRLPYFYKSIDKKRYKDGILVLELAKWPLKLIVII